MSVSEESGLPLESHVIQDQQFPDAYGITNTGAVIVRPDGIVAWRAADATGASTSTMEDVLTALLCRNDQPGG
jgi:putative polyketide hydroxylase